MFKKPLVDKEMIRHSEHGQVEKRISTLTHGGTDWDGVSLQISEEYAKLVQEFPEYEFGIIGDNTKGVLRITWKRRQET
jgi:hypothetical protein